MVSASCLSSLTVSGCSPGADFPALRQLLDALEGLAAPVELETLRRLLRELDVTRSDLKPACVFSEHSYQRNLLRSTPVYDLLLLCWRPGQRSAVHDHAGSACAFRVLEGTAVETRYTISPDPGLAVPVAVRWLPEGFVCCATDADVHRIENPVAVGRELITLHVYVPPLRMNVYRAAEEVE